MCRGCGKQTAFLTMIVSPILSLQVPLCKLCKVRVALFPDAEARKTVFCGILYVHFSWLSHNM